MEAGSAEELDKKTLGVKILKKYIIKATVDFQASGMLVTESLYCGLG